MRGDESSVIEISDYALIGDTRTAALVSRNGSIDWLCAPRFDSGACFAAILGTPENGRWRIAPADSHASTQRTYRPDSLVLETTFTTATGTVRLTDAMIVGEGPARIARIVTGLSGSIDMRMDLTIRFDYGSIVPWVRDLDGALVAIAGPDSLTLFTRVDVRGEGMSSVAEFRIAPGESVTFDLAYARSYEERPAVCDVQAAIAATDAFWRRWAAQCTFAGNDRDAVVRSLITLKALIYEPTGAVTAAPTMALPEAFGGVRNWDYRYCWLRDATFVLLALAKIGYVEEANAWRRWLLRAIAGAPDKLQIMYGLRGERRFSETVLDWLPGFANSAPVRLGNAAVDQFQLDVYGEVIDVLYQAVESGLPNDKDAWSLALAVIDHVTKRWREPDLGLWEVRGPPQHFTHSKVLAWVAIDRAVKAVERHGNNGPIDAWRALRDEMHAEICTRAFDARRNTFVQAYDSTSLDASTLLIPLVGFLPPDDPRVAGTVAAIEHGLMNGGFVQRYTEDDAAKTDGLPPGEGAFLACNFWLVDNYVLVGRRSDARDLFDRLLSIRNDLGLLAEEYDPRGRRQVGNFPQAFSHVGMINSAMNLTWGDTPAEQRSRFAPL